MIKVLTMMRRQKQQLHQMNFIISKKLIKYNFNHVVMQHSRNLYYFRPKKKIQDADAKKVIQHVKGLGASGLQHWWSQD